jgi:hypothetical protein
MAKKCKVCGQKKTSKIYGYIWSRLRQKWILKTIAVCPRNSCFE